jgi:adenylate kinase
MFDGYPRTIRQAENLEKILKVIPENLIVLNIEVSAGLLIERMETRRVCSKCDKVFFRPEENGIKECNECGGKLIQRQEDSSGVISKRIEVYEQQTKPLVEFYKTHGTLVNINGNPSIDEVSKEISEKLKEILK